MMRINGSTIYKDILILFLLGLVFIFPIFIFPSIDDIRYPRVFVVDKGSTIRQVAEELKDENLIISVNAFIISTYIVGNKVLRGSYYLERPLGVFFLAKQIAEGRRNVPIKKFIVREQTTVHDLTDLVVEEFPNINREEFEKLAILNSGYLYPDTYFFPRDAEPTALEIINIMLETFESKTESIKNSYTEDEWSDIVKVASIIELEASQNIDRKLISGVIYNRLKDDIPLQVDVSFLFINRKDTFDLSRDDLQIEDPFNSYRNIGLPPSPISNPTISSINAATNPVEHEYLYFLADRQGNTYFSETFQEHVNKKQIYLK